MIALYRWDARSGKGGWREVAELPAERCADLPDGDVWWIDLEDPSDEEERAVLGRFLPVHPLTLEDITRPRRGPHGGHHFPKVEEFRDYLFVVVNPLRPEFLADPAKAFRDFPRGERINEQLSAVLTRKVLVTHHYGPLPSVAAVKQFLYRHDDQAARGPDYLFHLVLDATVDEYAPVVDRIADELDRVELHIFRRRPARVLARLVRLKRQIVVLRKTLLLEREVLLRLTRGEFALVDAREIAYYRNVYDHIVRYAELVESSREMVSDLLQSYLAALSNRLNGIMKVLAMISTVILPMGLIASIYGMNFRKGMPELDWEYGYAFALGLMVLTAAAAAGFFYWKKWL
jgi:magnesium transporter